MELLPDERLDQVNERLSLIRKTDGLTFGTDAYLLASFVRPNPKGYGVELGTGTGIVSLLLAARGRLAHIDAVEIQPDFASLADRNVALNGLEDRVAVHCGDIRDLRPDAFGREFDAVFANPPYMRTDSGKRNESDHKYLARHEVCGTIGDFCGAARRLLKHGGYFYCVWRPDRLTELMTGLSENGLEAKTMAFVHADEDAEPSMVLVCAKKGGAAGLRVLPPLLLHAAIDRQAGRRALSARAQRIYDTMNFYEETRNEERKEK